MSFHHMNSVADGFSGSGGSASDKSDQEENKEPPTNAQPTTVKENISAKPHTSTSRFVAELRPDEVRWFYKKTTQDKTWLPLNGRDSLAIERAYRKQRERGKSASTPSEESKSDQEESPQSTERNSSVVVFDGLYCLVYESDDAVDSPTKEVAKIDGKTTNASEKPASAKVNCRLKPIYWEGSSLLLTRGTWFFEASGGDWQPLDADSAEFVQKIESKHLNVFSNQRIPDKPVYFDKGPKPVLCEVADAEEEKYAGYGAKARWHSVIDVLLFNNSRSSRLWRYLKLTGAGTKLMRGYHTAAKEEDGPLPVTRLVFVIHGLGQKRQRNKIVTNATSMREIADQLVRSAYPNLDGRPMFLPVDWRNELQLDEDLIASITPNYLEQIRGFFNETLMDLLYYASPRFGPEVISGLSNVLNRLYRLYLSNDPGFESRGGRVSLIAHSLGSVMTYDILTGGWYGKSEVPRNLGDRISIMPGVDTETVRLAFPVDHLFCFGSPLGVFLAARLRRGLKIIRRETSDGDSDTASPVFRLHNIYHPADPVAYRIEPLVSEIYGGIRPLRIHRHDTHEHTPYDKIAVEKLSTRSTARDRSASGRSTPKLDGPANEKSESEENVSGFESDEGPTLKVNQNVAASPSPPPKRGWGAAVFSRLGYGKSDKENTPPTPQRAPTPETDGEKAREGSAERVVKARAVEQAAEALEEATTIVKENKPEKEAEKKDVEEPLIPPDEALPYRIDYTLRQGRMEYAYWAAIVSHISYWANHDAVMYILSALYDPPKSDESK